MKLAEALGVARLIEVAAQSNFSDFTLRWFTLYKFTSYLANSSPNQIKELGYKTIQERFADYGVVYSEEEYRNQMNMFYESAKSKLERLKNSKGEGWFEGLYFRFKNLDETREIPSCCQIAPYGTCGTCEGDGDNLYEEDGEQYYECSCECHEIKEKRFVRLHAKEVRECVEHFNKVYNPTISTDRGVAKNLLTKKQIAVGGVALALAIFGQWNLLAMLGVGFLIIKSMTNTQEQTK